MIQWQEPSLSEFLEALPVLSLRERMFTTGKLGTTFQTLLYQTLEGNKEQFEITEAGDS